MRAKTLGFMVGAALAAVWTQATAQGRKVITGTDLVADFREMPGEAVTVTDCHIGGTSSAFIRCETPNGSASYALQAATMNRDDFKLALSQCPTGSRSKPDCRYSVIGTVKRSGMPEIESAKLAPYIPAGRK